LGRDVHRRFNLACAYADGAGVGADAAEAVRWHGIAAAQGHAKAQHCLGVASADGAGTPRDDAAAERWLRLAARQGHVPSYEPLAALLDGKEDPG